MPRLYLRESEPFLPLDPHQKMEERIQMNIKKDLFSVTEMGSEKQRRTARRTTSLILSDAVIIILEMLQILALIQSMSLMWAWPEMWFKYGNFIFIFNLDIWEFMKVQSEAYTNVQGSDTISSSVPMNYNYILLTWTIFIFMTVSVLLTAHTILKRRQSPHLMVYFAKLEQVFLTLIQVLAIPLGTVVFRLFHCTMDNTMAVFDNITCYAGVYWAYFVPGIIVIICLFGVTAVWMTHIIFSQRRAATTALHEDYMKLKEVEYISGLNVVWKVQSFYLFSSFCLPAMYYRPIVHLVKLVLLIIFAGGYSNIYNQAIALSVILSLAAISIPLIRPFRVTSFNVALGISLGCLAGDAVFGTVLTSVSPAMVESPWLVEPFSYYILLGINVIFAGLLSGWLIYMVSRRLCCHSCYPNDPLWPVLTEYEYEVKGMETYKFMAGVLRGRAILDACTKAPSVFAPVHHLARQIEIINAFCREAEKTGNGLHSTLLQLLDDLTDVHRRQEPVSLFADTVKKNIRENAARFVEMMPAFSQRLAQRDYDLILVHPAKKRLLMKMNIIGMFINGRRQRPVKDLLTQETLHKIWEEVPEIVEPKYQLEYGEDLYPAPLSGPDTELLYISGTVLKPQQLMNLDDSDEESLASFLSRVPSVLMMKDHDSRDGSQASLRMTVIEQENKRDRGDVATAESSLPLQVELTSALLDGGGASA